jgi:DNA (cytosine-5)-methyltransferase 1
MNGFCIDKKIRLIELFAGVGSTAMALRDIGADFEHYRVVEFDKYAVKSYNAIHGTNFEPMDIKKVQGVDLGIEKCNEFTYLLTYSFPCTDLSVAGKMAGMNRKDWEDGKATRSGLLWEVERLLNETENLPQVLLMENVPQVHGSRNIDDFNLWIDFLKSKGYSNFWQDLNAKDYGVAQNRKRCFMVSILENGIYEFPKPVKLTKRMKDYLADEVDERYYLRSEKADRLIAELESRGSLDGKEKVTCDCTVNKPKEIDVMNTIIARYDSGISNQRSWGGGSRMYLMNYNEVKKN